MMPAFPAVPLLLAAAIVLRMPEPPPPHAPMLTGRKLNIALAACVLIFAALPLGVIAATPRLHDRV